MNVEMTGRPGNATRVSLEGPLDDTAAGRLQAAFRPALAAAGTSVVADMATVGFVSAQAIQRLTAIAWSISRQGGRLFLSGCCADVADLIELVVPQRLIAILPATGEAPAAVPDTAIAVPASAPLHAEIAYLPVRRDLASAPPKERVRRSA
jgi:anti-anti-sigma factor